MTKKRILVVDDEQLSREGVAEVLADEGYEVATASDGHEAVTFEGAWRRGARARAQVPRSAARRVPVSGWPA